jgi:ABC-type Mn2+/Zn2+ transport system permease subunit
VTATASVVHALEDPWSQAIMRRALLEVALLALAGGTLGCWIVLRELSYGAESLAHGMLPGLVLASLAGVPLVLGGAAGMLVAAAAIALAGRVPRLRSDEAVAVVVTGLLGLGALLALAPATPAGIEALLFGDVLGTSRSDLLVGAGLAAVVLGTLWAAHWRLLAVGFDRGGARAIGARPSRVDAVLLALLALAVLVAVQGLGNLLVVSVLVAPAATARLLARRLGPMMLLAVAVAVVGGLGGLYLSYYVQVAAGASIAGLLVLAYLAARLGAQLSHLRQRPRLP